MLTPLKRFLNMQEMRWKRNNERGKNNERENKIRVWGPIRGLGGGAADVKRSWVFFKKYIFINLKINYYVK